MNGNTIATSKFNVMDTLQGLQFIRKRQIAVTLSRIEDLGLPEETYKEIRKYVLDSINDFYRDVIAEILGEIEENIYRGE